MPRESADADGENRAGGSCTRILASCLRTVRPSSGIGTLVRRRRALSIAVELRFPVARGPRPCAPVLQCDAPSTRRSSGCAEQWESRDPLLIAPCCAGRRAHYGVDVLRPAFLPGPSVVKQRRCSGRRAPRRRRVFCSSCSAGETHNAPPAVWRRWGVSNRSDPVGRWRCATARPPVTRTLHHCVLPRAIRSRSFCTTSHGTSSAAFGRSVARDVLRASTGHRPPRQPTHPSPSPRRACASSRRTGCRRRAVGARIGVE